MTCRASSDSGTRKFFALPKRAFMLSAGTVYTSRSISSSRANRIGLDRSPVRMSRRSARWVIVGSSRLLELRNCGPRLTWNGCDFVPLTTEKGLSFFNNLQIDVQPKGRCMRNNPF